MAGGLQDELTTLLGAIRAGKAEAKSRVVEMAKSWELGAVLSLRRLYGKQGRQQEARPMPARIHGWFLEGFDAAALQEAKAL